ncbi:MAG: gamma-glutamyltransferase [Candidatus Latescibacter sp.]|nr:gamma-glutamyltransferase [Candidatus Latescibacter sp.]
MADFTWDFPYPSKRMPILAKNVVASSHPLAAQAGLKMLQMGGNAVDAAVATAITLTVVEPNNNGMGSDAFAIVWDGKKLQGLNASGKSPKALSPKSFAGMQTIPSQGWGPTTVPGAVSAWMTLHEKYGKLPFCQLFMAAIDYAENGYLLTPVIGASWNSLVETYKDYPDWKNTFLFDGKPPKIGEKVVFKYHARTLKQIMETKGEAYYRGEIAKKIVAHSKKTGGYFSLEDFAEHKPMWVDPVSMEYRGYTLNEIPPNGQGIAALIMLGILKNFDMQKYPVDSADSLHLQIEAMKLAFADARRYVADPSYMTVKPADMLNPAYLAERAKLIDMKQAKNPSWGTPPRGGTVYLTAADSNGMMVSYIQSNFWSFGSGIVIPETGIPLQNRGLGFTLEEGHPNRVGGGKRPFHTIIPAFVTQKGKPVMSFGVMGGAMQPQGHAQMMIRIFDYHQNPQAAADGPRWQVMKDLEVALEPRVKPETVNELAARGHKIVSIDEPMYGGAQLIYKLADGYCAGSEPRKDGQAVGF